MVLREMWKGGMTAGGPCWAGATRCSVSRANRMSGAFPNASNSCRRLCTGAKRRWELNQLARKVPLRFAAGITPGGDGRTGAARRIPTATVTVVAPLVTTMGHFARTGHVAQHGAARLTRSRCYLGPRPGDSSNNWY
jgi:hypothetical protein